MIRVYFKCGKRALEDYQNKHNIISNLSSKLSTSENEIPNKVEVDLAVHKNSIKEINSLKEALSRYEVLDLLKDSSKFIIKNYENKSFSDIQLLGEQILKDSKVLFIGASLIDNKLLFINSLGDSSNFSNIFKGNLQRFNGKGGGNDIKMQSSFKDFKDIIAFEDFLKKSINI
jgi:alanyl-tRNA synthetase